MVARIVAHCRGWRHLLSPRLCWVLAPRSQTIPPPVAAPESDPAANQVLTLDGTMPPEGLNNVLQALEDRVENNTLAQSMDDLGDATGVQPGQVKELTDAFGGWTPINKGKFTIARKTDKGVFPVETVNVTRHAGKEGGSEQLYVQESSFDRSSKYVLLLSKVRTGANSDEQAVNNKPYQPQNEAPNTFAAGVIGFNGIEKTFKAYSPDTGSNAIVSFKTGYTGDISGTKAQYKVEVFQGKDATEDKKLYAATFKPEDSATTDEYALVAAKDGSGRQIDVTGKDKPAVNDILADNAPDGAAGLFTSREIVIPKGVTDYTVRVSSADDMHLGMSYQSKYLQYALPVTGVDFSVSQDTKAAAKHVLQKLYEALVASKDADTKRKTTQSVAAYNAELNTVKTLLDQSDLSSTADYKTTATGLMTAKNNLLPIDKNAIEKITEAASDKSDAIKALDLSEAEKDAALKRVEAEKVAALKAVEAASDDAGVIAAQNAGLAKIAAINPVGHEAAKQAIADALEKKKAEITKNSSLSEAEKKAAIGQAEKIAAEQNKLIDDQPTTANTAEEAKKAQEAINAARAAALDGIGKINPVGHEDAKKAIADALAQKKTEITNNSSLSDAEKKAAIAQAEQIAAEQNKLIDDQPTTANTAEEAKKAQEAINAARAAALDGIGKINPVGHEAAKQAIADALAQKKIEITNNSSLSEAEKKAAIGQAEQIAAEQNKLIDDQPTEADSADEAQKAQAAVDAAKQAAVDGIAKINPVGHEAAKQAIADALAQKKIEITNNSSLSEAEKKAAIGQAEQIAAEQNKLIDDQPTAAATAEEAKKAQAAIDAARAAALDGIAKINPVGHGNAKASGVKKLAVTGSALGATGLLAGLLLAGGVVARRRSAR